MQKIIKFILYVLGIKKPNIQRLYIGQSHNIHRQLPYVHLCSICGEIYEEYNLCWHIVGKTYFVIKNEKEFLLKCNLLPKIKSQA